jgi:hypothetical protein
MPSPKPLSFQPNTRAISVSAFLRRKGFVRTYFGGSRSGDDEQGTRRGYVVAEVDGKTIVRFVLGDTLAPVTTEEAREIVSEQIRKMEMALSERYTVLVFEPETGVDYQLTILPKE